MMGNDPDVQPGVFYVINLTINPESGFKIGGGRVFAYPSKHAAGNDFQKIVGFLESKINHGFLLPKTTKDDVVASIEIRNEKDWVSRVEMTIIDHTNEVKH